MHPLSWCYTTIGGYFRATMLGQEPSESGDLRSKHDHKPGQGCAFLCGHHLVLQPNHQLRCQLHRCGEELIDLRRLNQALVVVFVISLLFTVVNFSVRIVAVLT